MRRVAQIERRVLTTIGVLALALAYLPGLLGLLNAQASLACCTGMVCPMHRSAAEHMTCGMDTSHSGATCELCACHQNQSVGGLVFNRVSPPLAVAERVTRGALVLRNPAFRSVEPEIVSPPPRFVLL